MPRVAARRCYPRDLRGTRCDDVVVGAKTTTAVTGSTTLLAVDAATLYFRAFHGIPGTVQAPDGTPVNALRGYLDMTATLLERFSPGAYAACWDADWRPAFRTALLPSYKAHRLAEDGAEEVPDDLGPQVPLISEALALLGLARVEADGFEADDVCATVARRWTDTGHGPVEVVSGDRDLLQLVDDDAGVRVVYIGGGLRDAPALRRVDLTERYGVADGNGYLEMSVLRGDPSDGLPGVPGIGEKTAAALLREHGSLDGVLAAAADPGTVMPPARRGRLLESLQYVVTAHRVVRCVDDADVRPADPADWVLGTPQDDGLAVFGERWGCSRALERVAALVRPATV